MPCSYSVYGNHMAFCLALFMKQISSKNTFHALIYSRCYQFIIVDKIGIYRALKELFSKYKVLPMTKTKPGCKSLQYLTRYVFNLH